MKCACNHSDRSPLNQKLKFYRALRTFFVFSAISFAFMVTGQSTGMWKISLIWGAVLFAKYVHIFGWPGANGWLGSDWEAWMRERHNHAANPDDDAKADDANWREKDLV